MYIHVRQWKILTSGSAAGEPAGRTGAGRTRQSLSGMYEFISIFINISRYLCANVNICLYYVATQLFTNTVRANDEEGPSCRRYILHAFVRSYICI